MPVFLIQMMYLNENDQRRPNSSSRIGTCTSVHHTSIGLHDCLQSHRLCSSESALWFVLHQLFGAYCHLVSWIIPPLNFTAPPLALISAAFHSRLLMTEIFKLS